MQKKSHIRFLKVSRGVPATLVFPPGSLKKSYHILHQNIVPAKSKKEAMLIANRFIDDINEDRLDINKIVHFNPEYKIKVRKSSTQIGAFFIGGKR